MSYTSIEDTKPLMEQSIDDLSKAMKQLTETADGSTKVSTPPKNLCNMTDDVVRMIIDRLEYKEQLILRKTSKSLRALVDGGKPALTRLKVSCYYDFILCHYDDHCVMYIQPNWHHSNLVDYEENRLDSIVSNVNYEQDAYNDLASVFKNPKLHLEFFSFNIENDGNEWNSMDFGYYLDWKLCGDYKKIQNILESTNHQLSVRACRTDITCDISNIMSFLPYLKPGVLKKIILFMSDIFDEYRCAENFKQVSLLEQWKQAEELHTEDQEMTFYPTDKSFLTKYATHFKSFQFDEFELDWDTLLRIRDYISKHENAEFCLITDHDGYDFLKFEELVRNAGTHVSPNSSVYTLSDSKYYLEFKHENETIKIEKKKKK